MLDAHAKAATPKRRDVLRHRNRNIVALRSAGSFISLNDRLFRNTEGLIFGRDPDLCSYAAPFDADMSRVHFGLFKFDGLLHIIDMQSTQGTFVNGVEVLPTEPRILQVGHRITAGQTILHCVDHQDDPIFEARTIKELGSQQLFTHGSQRAASIRLGKSRKFLVGLLGDSIDAIYDLRHRSALVRGALQTANIRRSP